MGTVLRVEPPTAEHSTAEVVFHVTDGIRGVQTGTEFILREWAGLWPIALERYRVGQTLILFLHAPDSTGLTSPVGGNIGRMQVTGAATVKLTMQQRQDILRSPRLRLLFPLDTALAKTINTNDFLRALRLMTASSHF